MNCFMHEGAVAVGVCCNCGKGTCRSCAVDLGYAVTCSQSCTELARNRHVMESRTQLLSGVGGRKPQIPVPALMMAITGLVFLGFAISNAVNYGELDIVSIVGSIGFFSVTLVMHLRTRRTRIA